MTAPAPTPQRRGGGDAVVVGIDGSEGDPAAIAWGVRAARSQTLPLRLVHAHRHQFDLTVSDRMRAAEHLASEMAPDLKVRTIAATGEPAEVLLEFSQSAHVIVLAPHGQMHRLEDFSESTAATVGAQSRCPLVAVPRSPGRRPERGPVVVGVDGSPVSEAAIAFAFDYASGQGATLTAVHTWSDDARDSAVAQYSGLGGAAIENIENEILAERLAGWAAKFPDVQVHRVVTRDRAANTLLARAAAAQLLVVGAAGLPGLPGMLHGSTSQALLYQLPCPLAIVREHGFVF